MTNNDIIRRLRYSLNLSDSKMIALFALEKVDVTNPEKYEYMGESRDFELIEEPKLERKFEDEYVNYKNEVPRWIPNGLQDD